MNCCVTILLNTSIQIWTSFILLFVLHYLHFILPQQFQPFYPKQKMVMSTSFKFYDVFLSQILECSIPTQLNTSHAKEWYRHRTTKPTGEDNPAGSSCSVQAQEAPGFRQGPNPRPEDKFWPIIYCLSELLPLLHHDAEPPGEDCPKFEQKHLAGLGQDHRFPVFSVISDQEAPEPCQHRGLLSWCFIVTPMEPHEGPPTFQPENGGLLEIIQGAAKRIFRRGVEERELRERVNPVSPYHLHDDWRGSAFL